MLEIIIATFAFLLGGAVLGCAVVFMQKSKNGILENTECEEPAQEKTELCAVILCSGTIDENPARYTYKGAADCRAALAVGDGGRTCVAGCIGYGSCVSACLEEAISVRKGIAGIHPGKCTGCGACISVCPKELIVLVKRENAGGKRCRQGCPGGICDACGKNLR